MAGKSRCREDERSTYSVAGACGSRVRPCPVCAPSPRLTIRLWVQQVVKIQGVLAWRFFQTTGTKVDRCFLCCVFCVIGQTYHCDFVTLSPDPIGRRWVRLRLTWRPCPLQGGVGRKRLPRSLCSMAPTASVTEKQIILWEESNSLAPMGGRGRAAWPPQPLWQRSRSSCPPTKIFIKLQGKHKCSRPGQPEWFCSPGILIFMWDRSESQHETAFAACLSPLQCNYLIQTSPESLSIMARILFKWWK